jgi:hypothetical protein
MQNAEIVLKAVGVFRIQRPLAVAALFPFPLNSCSSSPIISGSKQRKD